MSERSFKTTCSAECCPVSSGDSFFKSIDAHIKKHQADKSCECVVCEGVRRATVEHWSVIVHFQVHCIGCGTQSPTQELPSPFCPMCAGDPKLKEYWRRLMAAVR